MLRSRAITTSSRCFSTSASAKWAGPFPRPIPAGIPLDIHPEVLQAQAEGRPIVALESTLITHGLPPPHSLDLPVQCEEILRAQGVTPATIAIIDGRIKVGLTHAELSLLADKGFAARSDGGKSLWKVGRRELGAAVVKKMVGGTTVSGTMAVAHMAGIKIFSTGGIGGVHRGAETSFDISSDLISLSDTPVAVVCAGSKSILDIGLTLEYLEAHAVPVAGFGTDDWPAFYTPKSGFKAPMRLDGAVQAAETILMTDRLGLPSSLLLGVPIPEPYHAVGEALQVAVEQAVRESEENGMSKSGKSATPWLLERVGQLTKGNAVESNKALIKNNVKVGGEVAIEYAKLLKQESTGSSSFVPAISGTPRGNSTTSSVPSSPISAFPTTSPLAVVGSLAIDVTMTPNSSSPLLTTAPGSIRLTLGGVAGNVAGAARSIGIDDVVLVAPVGNDLFGTVAKEGLAKRSMRTDGLVSRRSEATGSCGYLLDAKGELIGGVADMGITEEMTGAQVVDRLHVLEPRVVCFDGNLSSSTMADILSLSQEKRFSTFFEPTSDAKALRVLAALESLPSGAIPPTISYSTPNIHELTSLYTHMRNSEHPLYEAGPWFDGITVRADALAARLPEWILKEGVVQMAVQLLPVIRTIFVKSGSRGVVVVQRVSGVDAVAGWVRESWTKGIPLVVAKSDTDPGEAVVIRHFDALKLNDDAVGTVTGAGDNLAGAMLAALVRGWSPDVPSDLTAIVDLAQKAAITTLKSFEAVGDHSNLAPLLPAA
ncbi:Indigoidine synthase A-like protein [Meredithblackwellia eburnea MCA 4105]